MTISIRYYPGDNTYRTITPLVKSVSWSGDTTQAARQLDVSFLNTTDGETRKITIGVGREIRFYVSGTERFRGIIFRNDVNSDGTTSITAYDYNHYLTKNKDSMKFKSKKASEIIRSICKKYGIKYGAIADTKYVFPKLIFRNQTLYDIIVMALTETRKKTGKRYYLANEKGKLVLREVKAQVSRLQIKTGANLISASQSKSIEDLRNSVRVTGKAGEESKGVTVQSKESIKRYGLMQEKTHESEKKTKQLRPIAHALLKELNEVDSDCSVEAIGEPTIVAGKMVQVSEKISGLSGGFYVSNDTHTFEGDKHTMSLKVSKQLELPEIEYEDPTANENKSAEVVIDGKKISAISYQTGWIGTCYAYQLGGINGSKSGITATGTKVKEGRTIAVDPSLIPYGSVVAVYIPSLKQWSGLYLAEDTGGAIKGKHIDVAVKPSQVKTFGTRNIQIAIVERGKGPADARSKAKSWSSVEKRIKVKLTAKVEKLSASGSQAPTAQRKAVVSLARSFKGRLKYSFGGKNIAGGSGDCSGFTTYVFKKAIGKDIGHGTSTQLAKGHSVSKAQAQAGDLVFFQGTYRAGVSHVGIVTTPGKCVSLNGSGCTEHSYLTGYWGSHYLAIRRVLA